MQLLIALLGIVITIFFVVGVHEFGHFIVARLVGVKVLRFSIGFGKVLFRWRDKKNTEYVFSAIPLGGYVKMLDEGEGNVAPEEWPFSYNRQPFYKKLAIVSAGPLFNFIFALCIYWVLFMVGVTSIVPVIGKITPHSIAATAGMQPQEEIIQVNHIPTTNWMSVIIRFLDHAGNKDHMSIVTKKINSPQTTTYTLNLADWKMNDLKPDPLGSLGIIPYEPDVPAKIGNVLSPATSPLKKGDLILAVNTSPIKSWDELTNIIDKQPDATLSLKINREKKIMTISVTTSHQRDFTFKKHGYLGIEPDFIWPEKLIHRNQYGPILAFEHAWRNTIDFIYLNVMTLSKLLTGKISLASLGGPITIFATAGTALNHGLIPFFSFLAFLSIAIGLINILPIPGLDGGHVLFQTIELIIRRPIPLRYQLLFYRLGFILIFLLIFQAFINDVMRL